MSVRRILAVFPAAILAIASLVNAQTTPAPDIVLPLGDAARGKAVFEGKGGCLNCHRVAGNGSLFGPDLTTIGSTPVAIAGGRGGGGRGAAAPPPAAPGPTPQQLAQSILDPNAVVTPLNRYVLLKMKDGKTITAKLLSIDTFDIQIFDSTEKLANISRETVREMTMTSPMPSYRDKLSMQELADVISYLTSLRAQ